MPLLPYITQPLLPEHHYHIYNRGNEQGTLICYEASNYHYFLKKLRRYISEYMEVYAYCILPDHYHLAVRIKPQLEILQAARRDLKVLRKDAWTRIRLKLMGLLEQDLAVLDEDDHETGKINNYPSLFHVSDKLPNLDAPPITSVIPILPPTLLNELASWAVSEQLRRFHLSYSKSINKQQGRRGSLMQKPFRRKMVENREGMKRLIAYIHLNGIHHGYVGKASDYPYSSYLTLLSNSETTLARKAVFKLFESRSNFLRYHGIDQDPLDSSDYFIEDI